jgi:hypothetical protein
MSYINNCFNYYGKEKRQYRLDLDKANNNFTILANAFKDNNPDTGILKNTDTLNGYHASQIPQPNTIPASYDTGKLDVGWFSYKDIFEGIVEKVLEKYCNTNIIITNDSVATVGSGDINTIRFTALNNLIVNLEMKENMVLNMKLLAIPNTLIQKFPIEVGSYDSINRYIVLFPDHSLTPSPVIKMYDYSNTSYRYIPIGYAFTLGSNILDIHYYNIDIIKTKNMNYVRTYGMHLTYYKVDDVNRKILETDISLMNVYTPFPPDGLWSWHYLWKPYVYTNSYFPTYVPWTSLGTIRFPYNVDGLLFIKRIA